MAQSVCSTMLEIKMTSQFSLLPELKPVIISKRYVLKWTRLFPRHLPWKIGLIKLVAIENQCLHRIPDENIAPFSRISLLHSFIDITSSVTISKDFLKVNRKPSRYLIYWISCLLHFEIFPLFPWCRACREVRLRPICYSKRISRDINQTEYSFPIVWLINTTDVF